MILDINDHLDMEYGLKLYFLDSAKNVLTNMKFPGCHYNNGEITIGDFDSDSKDELCFKISWPTQSVPVIRTTHAYYKLIHNQLRNIFTIVTDDRDATVTEHKYGIQILREYNFENSHIEVKESEYRYDPDNFKFEEDISPKNLVNQSTYRLIYNSDSMKYVRN